MPGHEASVVLGGGAPCPPGGCWGSSVRPRLRHGCWENSQGPSGAFCSHHSGTGPTPPFLTPVAGQPRPTRLPAWLVADSPNCLVPRPALAATQTILNS